MTENSAPRLRFAPSPTGRLHVGNIRTALINWLFAKQSGGTFILRLDDTDRVRSKPEFEEGIREDLRWLGLDWSEEFTQYARMARYAEAAATLKAAGRLYPCYETPEELDMRRKLQVSRGSPPIYDRAALKLTAAQMAEYERQGHAPHWRFLLEEKDIVWDDLIRGETRFSGRFTSDPVLLREDGVPLFTFAAAVDDGDWSITHVVRGEDHVTNSAVQVQIFEALGFAVPQFAHMALLTMKGGKLSKREGGGDIRSLRAKGIFPLSIASYLAKIGTSDPVELADSPDALAESFSFSKMGRAAARYDEGELDRLNAKLLHHAPLAKVAPLLGDMGIPGLDAAFWDRVRPNLGTLQDVKEWWALVHEPIVPNIADAEYCKQAAALLPEGEWNAGTWQTFTAAVKEATGRKGKDLFMPLRLALTARADGPDLHLVFELLGRDKARKRLLGEVA